MTPDETGERVRPYAYDELRKWADSTPGVDFNRAHARLADLLKPIDGALGLSDWDRLLDQVKRELEAELRTAGVEVGDGPRLLREVAANLSRAYRFDADWHGPLLALFVIQSAVASAFPRVFHVYLLGPPGSGKTGLGLRVVTLCGGSLLGDASTAALARTTKHGRTIGIDEADSIRGGGAEAREAREALVRDAYRADAPLYVRFNPKTGKNEEYPTFGPRVIITREDPDTATAQRGIPIGCVAPIGDDTYELLVEGIWPSGVNELANRVEAWGTRRMTELQPGELQQIASRPDFIARVRDVAGTTAAHRETELAVVMLLVVEIAGLPFEELRPVVSAALSAGMVSSVSGDEQPAADAMAALRRLLPPSATLPTLDAGATPIAGQRVKRKDWLEVTNRIRTERHDPNIPSRKFGSVLKDIGVKESWKVGTGGVVSLDLPAEAVEAARNGSSTLRPIPGPLHPEVPHLPHLPTLQSGEVGDGATVPHSPVSDGESGVSGVSGVGGGVSPPSPSSKRLPDRPRKGRDGPDEGAPEEDLGLTETRADRARARLEQRPE